MADVIGSEKLAVSAQQHLRQGERVVGAIPASSLSPAKKAVSRRILPLVLYHQLRSPHRVIVATDQRVIVMKRGMGGFASGRAGRIVSEHEKTSRLDGEYLPTRDLRVTTLGKSLYVTERNVGDLLRLDNLLPKSS